MMAWASMTIAGLAEVVLADHDCPLKDRMACAQASHSQRKFWVSVCRGVVT